MVIVNKKHVPVEMMKVFDEPTTVLPPWYPGAGGVE
jgi:aminopeptidase C